MGISAVPATAWAADSYKGNGESRIAKSNPEMGADYAQGILQDRRWRSEENAEIKLSLDDGGKAIA